MFTFLWVPELTPGLSYPLLTVTVAESEFVKAPSRLRLMTRDFFFN
jgi:hypothetical protein